MSRAWDEAEAVLLASEDLDAVMEVIREAESPVEARRALKLGFGFTGRQAALLLTLPVMSFTRSERQRIDDSRRARMELLADVTGMIPAVPAEEPETFAQPFESSAPSAPSASTVTTGHGDQIEWPELTERAERADSSFFTGPDDPADDWNSSFGAAFDGVLADISSAMAEPTEDAPPLIAAPPAPASEPSTFGAASDASPDAVPDALPDVEWEAGSDSESGTEIWPEPETASRPVRRSMVAREETSAVLDDQIGELCDAIATLVGSVPPGDVWSDDPRSSSAESGAQLDSCGVNDETGLRTLLWHLHRTGLDSVEGLFPFAEPLPARLGFVAQSARFEIAMAAVALGSQPSPDVRWASGLWPIAERSGYGYAVAYGGGADSGAVWAYGGDEPLHRLWDSVLDLLVELYQSLMTGSPCDAAVAAPIDGRVVWTNLS